MLTELEDLQHSDETVYGIDLTFDVETRSDDGDELVERHYTFSYAKEFDKWTFTEFKEKRASNSDKAHERNWRRSRHIMWYEANETPTIDVPPEVSNALEEATGAEAVTLQEP